MKEMFFAGMCGILLVFALVFSVDAEVARADRANGIAPRDCVFKTNCWKGDLT